MVSSSLNKNIYADKISADKINANQIKANQIINKSNSQNNNQSPSYLFSMDINKASYDSLSGILSFSKDSVIDIIQFSDRPLKYSKDITIEEFDELFSEGISDNFTEQKPNLVLNLMNSGQNSFELTKFEVKNGTINYTLQNIGTQTINIPSFNNQRISLFVDDSTTPTTSTTPKIDQILNLHKNQKSIFIRFQDGSLFIDYFYPFITQGQTCTLIDEINTINKTTSGELEINYFYAVYQPSYEKKIAVVSIYEYDIYNIFTS